MLFALLLLRNTLKHFCHTPQFLKLSVGVPFQGTLISSESMVYLLKDRDQVGQSASRSVGFSKWTVLIGRTGFDTISSIPDPTPSLKRGANRVGARLSCPEARRNSRSDFRVSEARQIRLEVNNAHTRSAQRCLARHTGFALPPPPGPVHRQKHAARAYTGRMMNSGVGADDPFSVERAGGAEAHQGLGGPRGSGHAKLSTDQSHPHQTVRVVPGARGAPRETSSAGQPRAPQPRRQHEADDRQVEVR
jgi:hypothetical protein